MGVGQRASVFLPTGCSDLLWKGELFGTSPPGTEAMVFEKPGAGGERALLWWKLPKDLVLPPGVASLGEAGLAAGKL